VVVGGCFHSIAELKSSLVYGSVVITLHMLADGISKFGLNVCERVGRSAT
jgi:hypothetical protein